MAEPWLLIAVVGLAATEVSCQPEYIYPEPPPLPTAGTLLCISNAYLQFGNFYVITL